MVDRFNIRYRKNNDIIYRKVAGEAMLLPISQKVGEIRSSLYTLNETAAYAWEMLDGERTLADICILMVAEFAVDADQAKQDLLELVEQLEEIGALQVVEDQAGDI